MLARAPTWPCLLPQLHLCSAIVASPFLVVFLPDQQSFVLMLDLARGSKSVRGLGPRACRQKRTNVDRPLDNGIVSDESSESHMPTKPVKVWVLVRFISFLWTLEFYTQLGSYSLWEVKTTGGLDRYIDICGEG